ncbi:nucleoside phosphorylase domain-containing protein [Aspergillus insuetus]
MRLKSRNNFAIAIICALPLEADAVKALFNKLYNQLGKYYNKQPSNANVYINGRIGKYNMVLCYMPGIGKRSIASVASSLKISYRGVKLALVVSIYRGAPSPPKKTGVQDTLGRLEKVARWSYPRVSNVLFRASYLYKHYSLPSPAKCSCFESDSPERVCEALGRDCDEIGCDGVASADTVIKSGQHRDEIARKEKVIGFKMEGAGAWDNVPCIIIKGVCDYADSHNGKRWQADAAATGLSSSEPWSALKFPPAGPVTSYEAAT